LTKGTKRQVDYFSLTFGRRYSRSKVKIKAFLFCTLLAYSYLCTDLKQKEKDVWIRNAGDYRQKIPELMNGLGKGVKSFKDGMKDEGPSPDPSKRGEKDNEQ